MPFIKLLYRVLVIGAELVAVLWFAQADYQFFYQGF